MFKRRNDVTAARRHARQDAWSDRRAGGFGKGKVRRPARQKTDQAATAYDRTYTRHTPRRWR